MGDAADDLFDMLMRRDREMDFERGLPRRRKGRGHSLAPLTQNELVHNKIATGADVRDAHKLGAKLKAALKK